MQSPPLQHAVHLFREGVLAGGAAGSVCREALAVCEHMMHPRYAALRRTPAPVLTLAAAAPAEPESPVAALPVAAGLAVAAPREPSPPPLVVSAKPVAASIASASGFVAPPTTFVAPVPPLPAAPTTTFAAPPPPPTTTTFAEPLASEPSPKRALLAAVPEDAPVLPPAAPLKPSAAPMAPAAVPKVAPVAVVSSELAPAVVDDGPDTEDEEDA